MDKHITKLLTSVGVRRTLKGFRYIKYGLMLCVKDENYLLYICKEMYPAIANRFDTSPSNVERCIRTAVENCWTYGNRKLLNKIAGYDLQIKPTNSEFIDIMYNYVSYAGDK